MPEVRLLLQCYLTTIRAGRREYTYPKTFSVVSIDVVLNDSRDGTRCRGEARLQGSPRSLKR
ncbi:MAG: hypothetical protein QW339_01285 [Sulfolobales archaeon]